MAAASPPLSGRGRRGAAPEAAVVADRCRVNLLFGRPAQITALALVCSFLLISNGASARPLGQLASATRRLQAAAAVSGASQQQQQQHLFLHRHFHAHEHLDVVKHLPHGFLTRPALDASCPPCRMDARGYSHGAPLCTAPPQDYGPVRHQGLPAYAGLP